MSPRTTCWRCALKLSTSPSPSSHTRRTTLQTRFSTSSRASTGNETVHARSRARAPPISGGRSGLHTSAERALRRPRAGTRLHARRGGANGPQQVTQDVGDSAAAAAAQREADVEANVRLVRRSFGDTLPEGLLDEEGTRVYERFYGTPVMSASVEAYGSEGEAEVDGVEGEEEEERLMRYGEVVLKEASGETLSAEEAEVLGDEVMKRRWEAFVEAEDVQAEEEEARFEETAVEDPDDEEEDVWPGDEHRIRTHPLTAMARFCTSPTTVQLPKPTFVEPVTAMIAKATTRQLRVVAEAAFDGPGLPYSPATPRRSRVMAQMPIPLTPAQRDMSEMQSFVYAATVMPGVYASVLGVLTEVRKRLGKSWLRGLMGQEGGPSVLDAGAGGAGVLAWRDVVRAEWEAMHEELVGEERADSTETSSRKENVPYGRASVLTASNALRERASRLLDNTSFIPRLPEAVKADGHEARKQYDVIIAPHTLWPLGQEYMRKAHVETLWSLLKPDGGVLVLLEKGVPRGFEVIAGARARLLKNHILTGGEISKAGARGHEEASERTTEAGEGPEKEGGMIIAPCTNHGACPMYKFPGVSQARKDWCHFAQRFIRPHFLQHILGAKQSNHDDVEFSYLAVQRGKDLRQSFDEAAERHEDSRILGAMARPVQDAATTDRAFVGFETHPIFTGKEPPSSPEAEAEVDHAAGQPHAVQPDTSRAAEGTAATAPNALSLPRMILPPLKRRKHVIVDVCTPSATLERWVVTKGFSAQAYRDARKSSWGDLWTLGAKTRGPKRVDLGRQAQRVVEREMKAMEDGVELGEVDVSEARGGEAPKRRKTRREKEEKRRRVKEERRMVLTEA